MSDTITAPTASRPETPPGPCRASQPITPRRAWRRTLLLAGMILAAYGFGAALPVLLDDTPNAILPGEFEDHEGLLFPWCPQPGWPSLVTPIPRELHAHYEDMMVEMISAVHEQITPVCLVPNRHIEDVARRKLQQRGVPLERVQFVRAPFELAWTRDYGPKVVKTRNGSFSWVDADYYTDEPKGEDKIPVALARLFGGRLVHAPFFLDGGNLLSNGAGLILTTHELMLVNEHTDRQVSEVLRSYFGARDVVFLEPMAGELTRHVDIFATFVAPDTIVVGQCDRSVDEINAVILDKNARLLAGLRTPYGPLKVVRIPMPPPSFEPLKWYTYTNVVFANGTLLVPSYQSVDPQIEAQAMDVYRRVLPGWKIVPVPCDELIVGGGALHCMTMNLYRLPTADPSGT